VRWSDGSLSLQLGSELFDMTLTLDHSAVLSSSTDILVRDHPLLDFLTRAFSSSSLFTAGPLSRRLEMMEHQHLVTAELPLANVPVPSGGKIWHARMPNFLEMSGTILCLTS
jgi:hypothetical protein